MKLRAEHKIGVGFVLVVLLGYFGYEAYARMSVANLHFNPVVPSRVNLVGIDPGSGYQVIVANSVAQLVEASDEFAAPESAGGGAESGAVKRRVPIKEMLGVLRGNTKDLGEFVAIMNDLRENDKWPTVYVVWTAEDLRKALDGDPKLAPKLERDLNVKLDGTPLRTLRPSALQNGIIIDFPVSLTVGINGVQREVTGRVRQPYKPRILMVVEEKLKEKLVTPEMMAGYYAVTAKEHLDDSKKREDIRRSIDNIISKRRADELRDAPERVLRSATVVINEQQITRASYNTYDVGNGKKGFDLTIDLTDEGRKRLWKYSIDRIPSNLLLIVNGVAYQSSRIVRPLTESELTIRRMTDEVLVRDAVEELNKAAGGSAK